MPQKHKAATEVSIAPTEESPLRDFVQRYWKLGAMLAAVVVAAVLGRELMSQRAEEARQASWDRLREEVDFGSGIFASITLPSAATLETLGEEIAGTSAGPWARALHVQKLIQEGSYFEAADALQRLEEEYPDHPLVTGYLRFEEGASPQPLKDHLLSKMEAVRRWEKEHQGLFQNPPPPDDAPRVRLDTSAGSIVLAMYPEHAPEHAENFVKLCQEGFYDGTLFHRVMPDFMVQGGDPNSRDQADKTTWGQGGPGYKLAPETSELRHFPYVLAMAKGPMDEESSGSQFYITVGSPHHLDGVHTVFGTVLEGETVVDEIAAGEIEEGTSDRPRDPVVVRGTEVLE